MIAQIPNWLQYGALGLAAMLIVFAYLIIDRFMKFMQIETSQQRMVQGEQTKAIIDLADRMTDNAQSVDHLTATVDTLINGKPKARPRRRS